MLHGGPVRLASHDNGNRWFHDCAAFHAMMFGISMFSSMAMRSFRSSFIFFRRRSCNWSARSGPLQRGDGDIEVTVLLQQILQLGANCHFLKRVHCPARAPKRLF